MHNFLSFLAVIPAGTMDNWYSRVKEEIKKQQEDPVWMSENKVTVLLFYGAQFCFTFPPLIE